jgi:3-deoxy-D-manno-octulosonic-acid transferase
MRLLRLLFTYLGFALAMPFLAGHRKLRHGLAARFGLHPQGWPPVSGGPRVWLHGASAGDVLALAPFARELQKRQPAVAIIASTVTDSGRAMAEKQGATFAAVTYWPWDLPGPVKRTLKRIRPDVLVLEYTELWPELIEQAHRAGVKLVLHNGRFAAHRVNSYRRLFLITGNLLRHFDLLLMRDEYEADRARRLGAPPERIHITGNTKFDNLRLEVPERLRIEIAAALAFPREVPVLVAGSTHEGEEEQLLDVFAELRRASPHLRLVLAPRYIERAARLLVLATHRGLTARLRSSPPAPADVVILDTIGELMACYSLATLVFVGGSFVTRGGQNILEPAACSKPVLFGPHMENFSDAVQVLLGRGGIQVASPEQLRRVLADLLGRDHYREELGVMAYEQVMGVRGAAFRNAELVAGLLAHG